MKRAELAWGFAEIFADLDSDQINQMLANNIPLETLDFFNTYGASFAESHGIEPDTGMRLSNLLIVGYLLRVLEERLRPGGDA